MNELPRIAYEDDPDPQKAGQGLIDAPMIRAILGYSEELYWMMSAAEQAALFYLLQARKPRISIEIGTRTGGSLQVISKFSDKVYSLDIDPNVAKELSSKFKNVEFITGDSKETLPKLIQYLQNKEEEVGFALVDGDHSTEGVKTDLNNLLKYEPKAPFFIVMHDSFNPACRLGCRKAMWSESKFVHAVELDFVQGVMNPSPAYRGQMWGGLALGILLPEHRKNKFEVTARGQMIYQLASRSVSGGRSYVENFKTGLKKVLKMK